MRIERLVVGAFGLFNRGITLDFRNAPFIVVHGDNESGKSTIMEAIVATIFGFANARDEEARRPWAEHDLYSCAVALRMDDSSLLEIGRNFQTHDVRVRQAKDDEITTIFSGKASPRSRSSETKHYADLLHERLNLGEASLFESSVFVRQEQLATELGEGIRRVVSGSGGTDYERSLNALQDRFFLLTKNNPWGSRDKQNPRQIETLESQRNDIKQKLSDQRDAEQRLNELIGQRRQYEESIAKLERDINETKQALEGVARLNQLKEERRRLSETETTLRQEIEHLQNTKERILIIQRELNEKYPDFDGAGMPFQQKLALSSELEDEARRREQALSIERTRLDAAQRNERRVAAIILSTALALILAVLGFLVVRITGCLAGLLVGAALGYLLSRLVPYVPGARSAIARARVAMLKEQLDDLQERRTQVVNEIIALCGTSDIAAISVQFEEYRALKTQLQKAEQDVERAPPEEEMQPQMNEVLQELAVVQTQIEQLLATSASLRELADDPHEALACETRLRGTLEENAAALDAAEQRLNELDVAIASQGAAGIQNRASLEEQCEEIQRELDQLALRRDALKCAVDVMAEAIAEYRKDYLPRLEREIGDQFSAIVGNKYGRIHFDKSLVPRLDGPDRADITPAELSVGTRDQLYFAMRLAFARQMSGSEALPLILDDPFGNFDEHRLAAVRQLLESTSAHQQIILFTHDRRLSDWGGLVIDLNETGASER
jgi:DNA repair exonuclease SbcCD ATPase subunit